MKIKCWKFFIQLEWNAIDGHTQDGQRKDSAMKTIFSHDSSKNATSFLIYNFFQVQIHKKNSLIFENLHIFFFQRRGTSATSSALHTSAFIEVFYRIARTKPNGHVVK